MDHRNRMPRISPNSTSARRQLLSDDSFLDQTPSFNLSKWQDSLPQDLLSYLSQPYNSAGLELPSTSETGWLPYGIKGFLSAPPLYKLLNLLLPAISAGPTMGTGSSAAGCRLRRKNSQAAIAENTIATTPTVTPIPIFAPLLKPPFCPAGEIDVVGISEVAVPLVPGFDVGLELAAAVAAVGVVVGVAKLYPSTGTAIIKAGSVKVVVADVKLFVAGSA